MRQGRACGSAHRSQACAQPGSARARLDAGQQGSLLAGQGLQLVLDKVPRGQQVRLLPGGEGRRLLRTRSPDVSSADQLAAVVCTCASGTAVRARLLMAAPSTQTSLPASPSHAAPSQRSSGPASRSAQRQRSPGSKLKPSSPEHLLGGARQVGRPQTPAAAGRTHSPCTGAPAACWPDPPWLPRCRPGPAPAAGAGRGRRCSR